MNDANTILIVDDEPDQRSRYAEMLSSAGYQVLQASTAEEGLRLAGEVRPDLVLLDVALPDIGGFEVCRRIKKTPALAGTSVLMFSSKYVDSDGQAGGLEVGADGYIVKPIETREFLARVNVLLKMKRNERELRQAHREIYQILAAIQTMLVAVNADGRVTRWNWSATKLLNISFDTAYNSMLDALQITWERDRVQEGIRSCKDKLASIRIDDLWFERPDGHDGFLRLTIDPILDIHGGTFNGVLLLGDDVTDLMIMESQLLHAQKLEAIGQLAAGIAHEINTPIQFISDNTRFLKDAFQDIMLLSQVCHEMVYGTEKSNFSPERARRLREEFERVDMPYLCREIPQAIDQSLDGLERVTHIVRSMKSFAHPGEGRMALADLNKALADTVTVSRNEWKYVADVHMDLDSELPRIPSYLSELNQAFLNILTNAAQAIGEAFGDEAGAKGRITITSRAVKDWIEVRITDNGGGIPHEIQSRIFDPFFTTKEVGKGTGQGLAIAHSAVVKRHQGTITVDSKVGEGTTFIIRLPVVCTENGTSSQIS